MNNPFNPSFGKVPPIFLDRQQQLEQVMNGLQNPNSPYQTTMIYGMRGVGKTSFLTDISNSMRKRPDWIVADLAIGDDMVANLIDIIYQNATFKTQQLLQSISGISFSAFGFNITANLTTISTSSYQQILDVVLAKLTQNGIHVLVTIDEAQATKSMKLLMSIYQIMMRKNYSISLVMTGLPEKVSELQNDDVLTFLLRSERVELTNLKEWSMINSYQQAFNEAHRSLPLDVNQRMVQLTKGYAYAFQLLGYLVWETGETKIDQSTIDDIIPTYQIGLYKNVYHKIYQGLTDMERQFVLAMANQDDDQISMKVIGEQLQKPKNYLSVYRRRLLDTQVIVSPMHGKVQFTLPLFKEFLFLQTGFED